MGFNTAMIVRNDFLHEIKEDTRFGEKVNTAICCNGDERRMPYLGQAFSVLPSSHADYTQIVAVGGNSIRKLVVGARTADDVALLRSLAAHLGYRIVKIRRGNG